MTRSTSTKSPPGASKLREPAACEAGVGRSTFQQGKHACRHSDAGVTARQVRTPCAAAGTRRKAHGEAFAFRCFDFSSIVIRVYTVHCLRHL